jgi:hypothetical protein
VAEQHAAQKTAQQIAANQSIQQQKKENQIPEVPEIGSICGNMPDDAKNLITRQGFEP